MKQEPPTPLSEEALFIAGASAGPKTGVQAKAEYVNGMA
jgi:hypothetical protein